MHTHTYTRKTTRVKKRKKKRKIHNQSGLLHGDEWWEAGGVKNIQHSATYRLVWHIQYHSQKKTCYLRLLLFFFASDELQLLTWRLTRCGMEGELALRNRPEVAGNCSRCLDQACGCHPLFHCLLLSVSIFLLALNAPRNPKESQMFLSVCVCLWTAADDYLGSGVCHGGSRHQSLWHYRYFLS